MITVRWGIALKIGLPRLRLSRKLLFITLGITVLLGGSGVTALYFGGQSLLVEGGENAIGGECVDIQTMVVKTPSNHLWLRKFIRMENASGHERVRTALRIAGNLAKNNAVDLIHVSVLDTHGPTKRADMRARAIGAEVLIALKPDNLPEMKSPAMASYYEGPVSDAGRFYGDKVVVDIDEIGSMMTAMRTVEEKPDCVNPAGDAEAAKNDGHGKTDKKDGHDKPKEGHDKPANDHGEKPAEDHGEKPASDHGEDPAKEGADAAEPAKEQSFVDSMLSMVGLGGGETPADAADHPAAETSADAPAEGHDTAKSSEGHDQQPAVEDHSSARTEEAVAEEPVDAANGHDTAEPVEAQKANSAENAGHDTSDEKAESAAEDHSAAEIPAAAEHEGADAKAEATAQDHEAPAEDATAPAPAEDDHAAEAAPDAAAEDHGETSAKSGANDHGDTKKPKPDEHAEVDMPVGD